MCPLGRFARALSVAALLAAFGAQGFAQQNGKASMADVPTGLSVEIDTKVGSVGYQSVPGQSFGGRYKRLPTWRPSEGYVEPTTFEVVDSLEGGAVRVQVYAVMDKFRERRRLIGDYLLREGQKVSADGLMEFGYEPMALSIIRVKRPPLHLPETATKAPSVLPVSVEPRQTDFPSFKIKLQNLSDRNITFLEVRTFVGGMLATREWKRGEQNRPMIKAGGTFDLVVNGGETGQKEEDLYVPSQPQRVEIAAAVFDDRSFEGEEQSAAMFAAHLRGQRAQIKRVLPLIEEAAASADAPNALDHFKQQVLRLGRVAGDSLLEEVWAEFSSSGQRARDALKIHVEGGLNRVRKELLEDIEEYVSAAGRGQAGRPFGEWMKNLRHKYESWLSRL